MAVAMCGRDACRAHRTRDSQRETAMAMSGKMAEEDAASHGGTLGGGM